MKFFLKVAISVLLILISVTITNAQTAVQPLLNGSIQIADSFFLARNWTKAKQLYETILKDTSKSALAWNRLGFTYYNLKMNDAALKCFKKSLSQMPPPALKIIVYSRMARIHALHNDKQIAFTDLDSAVSLGYSNVAEIDTLTDYDKIRNDKYFKHLRDQVYINANPCMSNAHAREFDFWVGEWKVFQTGTKIVAGHSIIQLISGGCAILENWTSTGSNGKSINFIDPVTNKWKQSWAGNYVNGVQEFVNGEYKDSAMRFTFESADAQGNKINGRFIFYNEGPNQVRQFNETSADSGKTWSTSYDLTYVREK
ncbi:MAG: tetratricopeptide repeat protein [Ferruginibacter sp.]